MAIVEPEFRTKTPQKYVTQGFSDLRDVFPGSRLRFAASNAILAEKHGKTVGILLRKGTQDERCSTLLEFKETTMIYANWIVYSVKSSSS